MGRRPNQLDPSIPLHRFAIELRKLRDSAGAAGGCQATCKSAGISKATYYAWLSGVQLPGRAAFELTIASWRGDLQFWLLLRRDIEDCLLEKATKTPSEDRTSEKTAKLPTRTFVRPVEEPAESLYAQDIAVTDKQTRSLLPAYRTAVTVFTESLYTLRRSLGSPRADELVTLRLSPDRVKSILDGDALPTDVVVTCQQRIEVINALVFYAQEHAILTERVEVFAEQCREEARDLLRLMSRIDK